MITRLQRQQIASSKKSALVGFICGQPPRSCLILRRICPLNSKKFVFLPSDDILKGCLVLGGLYVIFKDQIFELKTYSDFILRRSSYGELSKLWPSGI